MVSPDVGSTRLLGIVTAGRLPTSGRLFREHRRVDPDIQRQQAASLMTYDCQRSPSLTLLITQSTFRRAFF